MGFSTLVSRCAHLLKIAGDSLCERACLTFPPRPVYVTQAAEPSVRLGDRQLINPAPPSACWGSPFLISPRLFFIYFPTHKLPHGGERPRSDCTAPPHTNSPAFSFFNALLACQQKWAGMDCFALKVSDRVIERGESATDVRGYSLMGLI